MADIDVYSEQDNYMKFQNLRPDYVRAIDFSIRSAEKYAKSSSGVVIADFCCGTGSNAKKIADNFNGIKKAIPALDLGVNKG